MLKYKNNGISWDSKEISFSALILYYINQKSPKDKKLNSDELEIIEDFIIDYFGYSFFKRVEDFKFFKNKKISELKNASKKRKLGSGSYGTVYPLDSRLIVKTIKDSDKKAKTESRIHDFLVKRVLFNKLIYSIPLLYQTQLGVNDYMVIERSEISFWEYITKHSKNSNFRQTVKSVIFQTVWSMAVLQKTFSGFRHNDLKLDNILLDFNDEVLYLKFGRDKFKISKVFVKISDFDWCNIPGNITNPKVCDSDSKTFGCTIDKSDHYDLHIFLNSLWLKNKSLPPSINKWVEKLLPENLRGLDNEYLKHGRLKDPKKVKLPDFKSLLADPFFSCFRVDKLMFPIWGN